MMEPRPHSDPVVSIVVLGRDLAALSDCLSLIASSVDRRSLAYETIVICEAMNRRDVDAIAGLAPGVRTLHVRVDVGIGPAFNLAARRAKGKYLVFLRDDAAVRPGWLQHLVDTAESAADVGVVGSRTISEVWGVEEAGIALLSDGSGKPHCGGSGGSNDPGYVHDVDCVDANGLLVRTDSYNAVGGFDDRYRPGGYEDRDLCLAIRHELKQRVVCDSRSVILEAGRGDATDPDSNDPDARYFLFERNKARFCAKWKHVLAAYPQPEPAPNDASEGAILERRMLDLAKFLRGRTAPEPQYEMASAEHEMASPELEKERARAEAVKAVLRATDRHAAGLEQRTLELEELLLHLQANIDRLHWEHATVADRIE